MFATIIEGEYNGGLKWPLFLRSALLNLFTLHMLEIVEVTLTSSLTQQYKLLTANIACYFLLITSGIQVPAPPPPPQFL